MGKTSNKTSKKSRGVSYKKSLVYYTISSNSRSVLWPTRSEVFDRLKASFKLKALIVASEDEEVDGRLTGVKTFKIFMQTAESIEGQSKSKNKIKAVDVRDNIKDLFESHCQWTTPYVQKADTYIKIATCADRDLLYWGLDKYDLSQNWRNWNGYLKYITKDSEFDYQNTTVKENGRETHALLKQFEAQKKLMKKAALITPRKFKLTGEDNWVEDLKKYCNRWKPGMAQPYIYGEQSTGKTTIVEDYLFFNEAQNGQVFTPHSEQGRVTTRMFDGYDPLVHTMSIYDEFDFRTVSIDQWKLGTENRIITLNLKHVNTTRPKINGLLMHMSNHLPSHYEELELGECTNGSIRKRIYPIQATRYAGSDKLFKALRNPKKSKFLFFLV